jgi:transcriptional regulator with XRE-family HTH domain
MTASFGEIVRDARAQRGWDQAELAKRVGTVGQQAVSRWERGTSRPRRADIGRVAQVLKLDERQLLTAAGYAATKAVRLDEVRPARPRPTTLPLDQLSPDLFEQFSADLASALYPGATVHRYGGQGHTQGGIDVLVTGANGTSIGIQCKRERQFGPAKAEKAVNALTAAVHECVIYLTRVASPETRKEISKHRGWKLWDVVDISRAVQTLADNDRALKIVDIYFPGWREPFLGVRAPGPWLSTEEFFRAFTGDRIYSHDWAMVGRSGELRELLEFLQMPGGALATIVGRGGIGKTRLLRALAQSAEQDGSANPRFLEVGATVQPEQYEILPPDDRLVIVIDDAHDRSDNALLIGGIRRFRPKAKILLSLRPTGLGSLTAELRQFGLHPSDLRSWTLDDLKIPDVATLAADVLGDGANPAVAQRLAAMAPDCPLLVVVGAGLLKRGQLDPALLESNDSIRAEILSRFRDAVVVDPATASPELRREVLNAVAALQPFRLNDPAFQGSLATLTGRAFDQVVSHLSGLEDTGVLLRRGTSLRVVPDLLGDVVLAGAALEVKSGTPTGYLDRVYRAAGGEALQHAFINASRVDWQVRQDRQGKTLVDSLWDRLFAEFRAAGINGRLALLKLLEKVAFFQPARAVNVIRWAIENPTDAVEETDHPLASLYPTDYSDVLKAVPPVLEAIGHNIDFLPDVADTLWDLARRDARAINQHPSHPIRILAELASYDFGKPKAFQEALIDAAERWLRRDDIADWPWSPFEVIKPILATVTESRFSDGLSLTLRSHPISVGAVADLRARVLRLAFTEARGDDLKRAIEAIATIESSIMYPPALFGREVTHEEKDRWTPSFVETIQQLGDLVSEEHLDPTVFIAVNRVLNWHAHHSPTQPREAAQTALTRVAVSNEYSFAQVLHDGWGHSLAYTGDFEEFSKSREAHMATVAQEAITAWSGDELVDKLEQQIGANRRAYGDKVGHPGPFVWTLVQKDMDIADRICQRITETPTSILRELVPVVLGALVTSRPSIGLARARELLSTSNLEVQASVAQTFGWGRAGRDELFDGEADLLRQLITHDNPVVRELAVGAASPLTKNHRPLAIELVTTVRLDAHAGIASKVAGAFSDNRLSWHDLTPSQKQGILDQLLDIPRIDDFQINAFLAYLSKIEPDVTLAFLLRRVEIFEQGAALKEYDALPFMWHQPLGFRHSPRFVEHMQHVIDWLEEETGSYRRQREGADVFAVVAEGFDEQVLQTLLKAVDTGREERIMAVGSILRKAPRTFVWDNVPFVVYALQAADRLGEKCVQAIGGGLHSSALSGGRWGTPGQPFKEDIEQRNRSDEVAASLPYGSIERRFYESLRESAEHRIKWEEEHDSGFGDGRDW